MKLFMSRAAALAVALLLSFNVAAAGKGNTYENDLLKLLFQATAIADIADNDATSPLTNLYVSLHTGDPGETSDCTTNETSYGSYARVAVARSGSGWTVTANSVSPAANIDFPAASSGTATITHWGVCTTASSTGKQLYFGGVSPSISVSSGVTPRLTTGTAATED